MVFLGRVSIDATPLGLGFVKQRFSTEIDPYGAVPNRTYRAWGLKLDEKTEN